MKADTYIIPKARQLAPNQIVMELPTYSVFQSYDSTIAIKHDDGTIELGSDWNYSRTTSKYRNQFLDMTTKEIKTDIKHGTIVVDTQL